MQATQITSRSECVLIKDDVMVFLIPIETPPPLLKERSHLYRLYVLEKEKTSSSLIAGCSHVSINAIMSDLLSSKKEEMRSRLDGMLRMLANDKDNDGEIRHSFGAM